MMCQAQTLQASQHIQGRSLRVLPHDIDGYRRSASYIRVDGHRLAYWYHGKPSAHDNPAPLILLIHGFPSASWDWHKIWPYLSTRFQLLAVDMLGFGLSEKPFEHQYRLSEQARRIAAVVSSLGVQPHHILAHDYGDSVAQVLLTQHYHGNLDWPLQSVCYLNGGLFSESHRPLLTQKVLKSVFGVWLVPFLTKASLARSFTKIFGNATPPDEQDITTLYQLLCVNKGKDVLPSLLSYIDERAEYRDEWVHAMQQTEVKQGFINGLQDPISGKHMLIRFAELLPDSDYTGINVGHYPQIEAADDVAEHYLRFLSDFHD
ncbi:alpha/beta hydrolase [Aestuariibacter sp. AA17]|uniref:Alpha/beta hydrolase n=1 Tax=Fluctibacter corallii TaxID=2984329 RepID=A0ABT3A319_9ALTE|nr:alpha/beta hydrolase [Aestuariibacter sp. AA17]MCV2883079.1 alpha/beta hydrolase [Aestuariibacter sp. AA17]